MSIFQKSIVKKHLSSENQEVIKAKWNLFTSYFHNATIQENIRNSKEEQFQEGFLRELFVKVLGYTLNPEPNFNLTTEYKNVKDSKKADGAIIINNHVKAVIELKGTDTTDLSKVENQAFNYKNNQPECVYVITSNFEKLRFYIDNAIEHLEFNLFNLTEDEFQLLYVCLAHKNIESNVPKQIKDESVSQEDVITKKLYNDYSLFKRELYQNLVKLNPSYDPLELFKKSQKLLDRFLFIFFSEDRSLLPTNLIFRINKEWQQLREMRIEVSLYDRYKIYFNDLNHGAKVSLPAFSQTTSAKKEEYQIYAYNGGLFQEDDILNSVKIDDDILFKHTENLSNYDFASEVDVNILGHIFENSLNELDEIKAQLEGQEVEKTKTKRKKDGVFYTPKYITKYIVDNTVGKLCADKKAELQLNEEDYTTDKKRQQKTKQVLSEKLNTYRNWLLQLTICDPACGSGAFLNQALDFLITEHRYIDELQAKLFGDALVLSDVEGSILENNLFGVDINEESVEIAKLSLWLRTAQPNRKLNDLNSNIKCGNSLIDDVSVAGDKAFNWQNEFKGVFENDGFDVIIGNPPYVRSRELFSNSEKEFYIKNFQTTSYQIDLYKLFIEKSCHLINEKGKVSFITPSVFLTNDYDKPLRKFLLENYHFDSFVSSEKDIFEDASVKAVIFIIAQKIKNDNFISFYKIVNNTVYFEKSISQQLFIEQDYLINERFNSNSASIINKLNKENKLKDFFIVKNGIKVRKELLYSKKENSNYKPFILGKNINPFINTYDGLYIDYLPENEKLYTNQAFRTPDVFETEKLISRQILGNRMITSYDNSNYYTDQTTYLIHSKSKGDLKYLLCIINSKLLHYYFCNTFSDNKVTFPKVKGSQLLELPFHNANDKSEFIKLADLMIETLEAFQKQKLQFINHLKSKFEIISIGRKLENWYEVDSKTFLKELVKAKVSISLSQEAEWINYFNEQKAMILELKAKIDATDKEIDQMVYKLYDLTDEEIAIVEGV